MLAAGKHTEESFRRQVQYVEYFKPGNFLLVFFFDEKNFLLVKKDNLLV